MNSHSHWRSTPTLAVVNAVVSWLILTRSCSLLEHRWKDFCAQQETLFQICPEDIATIHQSYLAEPNFSFRSRRCLMGDRNCPVELRNTPRCRTRAAETLRIRG